MELGVQDHGWEPGVALNEGVDDAVHQPVQIALGVGESAAPSPPRFSHWIPYYYITGRA